MNGPTVAADNFMPLGFQLEWGDPTSFVRTEGAVKLDELQARAMELSRRALVTYPPLPPALRSQLTLGTYFEPTETRFELYLPGERPADAIVLVSVSMDKRTGDGKVDVREENWRTLGLLPPGGDPGSGDH